MTKGFADTSIDAKNCKDEVLAAIVGIKARKQSAEAGQKGKRRRVRGMHVVFTPCQIDHPNFLSGGYIVVGLQVRSTRNMAGHLPTRATMSTCADASSKVGTYYILW